MYSRISLNKVKFFSCREGGQREYSGEQGLKRLSSVTYPDSIILIYKLPTNLT